MYYVIFRNGEEVARVQPLESSEVVERKEQDSFLRLDFVSGVLIDLRIGDYVTHERTGLLYVLRNAPTVVERPREYKYEAIFQSLIHTFQDIRAILYTNTVNGEFFDYRFSLTGTAQTFLQFIVESLQHRGVNITAGTAKQTDTTTLFFNDWTIMESIQQMAEMLEFDWWLENDKILHFDRRTVQQQEAFMVGRLNGLESLERQTLEEHKLSTVVYGFGSMDNLPPRTNQVGTFSSVLLYENRLYFHPDSRLERNVNLYGVREEIKEFQIRPEYRGTIESVDGLFSFVDTEIDFDVNEQLLPGIVAKCVFLSGTLSGMTFDINYNHSQKKITLIPLSEESGEYPNEIAFPKVGDTYTLVDLQMPQSYITAAQDRLREATETYIEENSVPQFVYNAVLDEEYIRIKQISLTLGDFIRIVAPAYRLDGLFEIKEIVQSITHKSRYQIKFGNALPRSLRFLLENTTFTNAQAIYNIQRTSITNNDITNIVDGEIPRWEQL